MKTTKKTKNNVRAAVLSGVITLVLALVAVTLRQDVGPGADPGEAHLPDGPNATSVVAGETPMMSL